MTELESERDTIKGQLKELDTMWDKLQWVDELQEQVDDLAMAKEAVEDELEITKQTLNSESEVKDEMCKRVMTLDKKIKDQDNTIKSLEKEKQELNT